MMGLSWDIEKFEMPSLSEGDVTKRKLWLELDKYRFLKTDNACQKSIAFNSQ